MLHVHQPEPALPVPATQSPGVSSLDPARHPRGRRLVPPAQNGSPRRRRRTATSRSAKYSSPAHRGFCWICAAHACAVLTRLFRFSAVNRSGQYTSPSWRATAGRGSPSSTPGDAHVVPPPAVVVVRFHDVGVEVGDVGSLRGQDLGVAFRMVEPPAAPRPRWSGRARARPGRAPPQRRAGRRSPARRCPCP